MPRYKCHKEVWALKIAEVRPSDLRMLTANEIDNLPIGEFTALGEGIIIPVEEGYGPIRVDTQYMLKHNPQPGGYYVVYEDGYKSFSPAEAFEGGYTRIES